MTTAHRPTWSSALAGGHGTRDGSSGITTKQISARDLTAHTLLKMRQPGQNAPSEILENEDLKRQLFLKERQDRLALTQGGEISEGGVPKEVDLDADASFSGSEKGAFPEESDDEEAELLRELERIRAERQAEKERAERAKTEQILTANPLLASKDQQKVRRWTDDVVFKNQAKDVDENPRKRFINDTIRSDFHRRFIDKYIR